jgi:hypothetical protein
MQVLGKYHLKAALLRLLAATLAAINDEINILCSVSYLGSCRSCPPRQAKHLRHALRTVQ